MRYAPRFLPSPWTVLSLVPCLLGTVARAEAPLVPMPRAVNLSRKLELSADPGAPRPRVRVGPGMLTSLLFDAPVVKESVRVEGAEGRVRVVDVGANSVFVEPLVELGAQGAVLRVRFADGGVPGEAALQLVGEPFQADLRVQVSRLAPNVEQLQETLLDLRKRCAASGLVELVLRSDVVHDDLKGASFIQPPGSSAPSALEPSGRWWSARVGRVSLISISVENISPDDTWRPDGATLIDLSDKGQLKVHGVHLLQPEVAPGESAHVVIEAEAPPLGHSCDYRLEVWDSSTGRRLVVPGVILLGPESAGSEKQ